MATVSMPPPSSFEAGSHRAYGAWLETCFFDQVCAYCGTAGRGIQIDHVEPTSFRPERRLDPTNLLPACADCNGRAGKSDYHPDHGARTRLPRDRTGFRALDPRVDDYARLYEIQGDGSLTARPGPGRERALWNAVVLFKLGRRGLVRARQESLELAFVGERLLERLVAEGRDPWGAVRPAGRALDWPFTKVLDVLARRWLFFELFEEGMGGSLRELACARWEVLRGSAKG